MNLPTTISRMAWKYGATDETFLTPVPRPTLRERLASTPWVQRLACRWLMADDTLGPAMADMLARARQRHEERQTRGALLTGNQRAVYACLFPTLPRRMERIAFSAGLTPRQTSVVLRNLRQKGLVAFEATGVRGCAVVGVWRKL